MIMSAISLPKPKLIDFGYNFYSQWGEDGIIEKIFEIIGAESKLAVEFGAWDGFKFSNTTFLWSKDLSWKAILIEGDAERYQELVENTKEYNVVPINAWVGIGKDDCLEKILKQHGIKQPIDLLSIDVDGNDYHIFASLKKLRPRVIICEYNPTIPIHYDVYAPYAKDNNFGQSVGALARIAAKKGYRLVALTHTNAFFVREEEFDKFADFETDWRLLNVNDGHIVVVTTYDGKCVFLNNNQSIYFYGVDGMYTGQLCGACQAWDGSRVPAMYTVKNEA